MIQQLNSLIVAVQSVLSFKIRDQLPFNNLLTTPSVSLQMSTLLIDTKFQNELLGEISRRKKVLLQLNILWNKQKKKVLVEYFNKERGERDLFPNIENKYLEWDKLIMKDGHLERDVGVYIYSKSLLCGLRSFTIRASTMDPLVSALVVATSAFLSLRLLSAMVSPLMSVLSIKLNYHLIFNIITPYVPEKLSYFIFYTYFEKMIKIVKVEKW